MEQRTCLQAGEFCMITLPMLANCARFPIILPLSEGPYARRIRLVAEATAKKKR